MKLFFILVLLSAQVTAQNTEHSLQQKKLGSTSQQSLNDSIKDGTIAPALVYNGWRWVPLPIPEKKIEWINISGLEILDSNNNLKQGTLSVLMRVLEGTKVLKEDTVDVEILTDGLKRECNILPFIDAGPDRTEVFGKTFTLNAGAKDLDGTVTAFKWSKLKGPTAGKISYSTRASTTVTGTVKGVYTYQVKGTDNKGGIASDTLTVTVK